jgi:osmotically inducible lipoprotein OsmB
MLSAMKTTKTTTSRLAVLGLCTLLLAGCSSMTHTQQRVVSGAALGAAAGVGVTAATGGCISCGAAIGTAVGAVTGYIVDRANQ